MKNSVQLQARECFILYVTDFFFFLKAYQWTIVVCIKRSTMEHMFLFLIKCDSSKPASSAMFLSLSHTTFQLLSLFFSSKWLNLFICFAFPFCVNVPVFVIIITITQAHQCWSGIQYKMMNIYHSFKRSKCPQMSPRIFSFVHWWEGVEKHSL